MKANQLEKSYAQNCCESYHYHESIKKNRYEQRNIDVDKAHFCPIVFACTGGAGPAASTALK